MQYEIAAYIAAAWGAAPGTWPWIEGHLEAARLSAKRI